MQGELSRREREVQWSVSLKRSLDRRFKCGQEIM
jgi:hypothetical protein